MKKRKVTVWMLSLLMAVSSLAETGVSVYAQVPGFRMGEDEQSAGERKAFGTAAKDETVTGEEVSAGELDTDAAILPGQDTLSGAYGNTTWTIDAAGKLTVKGTGNAYGADEYGDQNPQWLSYSDQIITAEVDLTGVTDLHNFFLGCNKLKSVDLSRLDTSQVTDMSYMFGMYFGGEPKGDPNTALRTLDLSKFNTSNVTSMEGMFNGLQNITGLDLTGFDTSKVKKMDYLFWLCKNLEDVNLSSFDTSGVTSMVSMFADCNSLSKVNVSNFNTSNVTDMDSMFTGCSSLKELNVTGFDTGKVINMSNMFEGCSGLEELDVSSFKTDNVYAMGEMFRNCSSLKTLDLSNFNTANVNNSMFQTMDYMFSGCSSLTSLKLDNFETSQLKVSVMFFMLFTTGIGGMFDECSSLPALDLSSFDLSGINTDQDDPNGSLKEKFASLLKDCTSLTVLESPKNVKVEINLPGNGWKRMDTGETVTIVPMNLKESIHLVRSGDNTPYKIKVNGEEVDSLKEAFKKITDPATDYIIELGEDLAGEKKITIPQKAGSVTVNGNGHKILLDGTVLTSGADLILENVTIESMKNKKTSFVLTSNRNLTIGTGVMVGFNKTRINCKRELIMNGSLTADSLSCQVMYLNADGELVTVPNGKYSITRSLIGNGGSISIPEGFKTPIKLKAAEGRVNLTGAIQADGTAILKASPKNLSTDNLRNIFNVDDIADDSEETHLYYYGNTARIFSEAISYNGKKYVLWKDVLAQMRHDIKAAKKAGSAEELVVEFSGNANLMGPFTLPPKGYKSLTIKGDAVLTFKGDLRLTGDTVIEKGITLKKVDAKGNELKLKIISGKYKLKDNR